MFFLVANELTSCHAVQLRICRSLLEGATRPSDTANHVSISVLHTLSGR